MFLKLLKLELKNLLRSPQLAASVIAKIGMFFVAAYFTIILVGGAFGLYFASKEEGENPLLYFSQFFILFWAIDLFIKYFMQQLPTNNIKPLLTQNISKNKIVVYTLLKISFSFLSWAFLLFVLPFTFLLCIDGGYSIIGVLCLMLSCTLLIFNNALVNIFINKNTTFLLVLVAIFGLVGLAYYLGWLDITKVSEKVFMSIYQQKYWVFLPIILFGIIGKIVFKMIKTNLYLDKGLELKKEVGKTENIAFLNRYGKIGVFINNDIRLIKRSKMARSSLFGAVAFLLYGLLYFNRGYHNDFMQVFLGIFCTGGFLFIFGQRVPAWDSSYYPLMMTQNIPYKEYLKAKWSMTIITTLIAMVLTIGYAYISWEFYFTIFAAGLYNLGVNSFLTLFSGAYNKKPIDLNATTKSFGGGQNKVSFKVMLILIPQLLLPMSIFAGMKYFFGMYPAVISLGVLGLIGFLMREKIFSQIVKVYKTEKYSTIAAFKKD
ncbi:MAG: hypothetical protein JST62_03055 [Bacteroidetes bacterium]|nr:hypothetical protein [Bacteroidota bacterium]